MKKAALLLVFVLLIPLVVWTAGCAEKEAPPTLTLSIRGVELCSAVRGDRDYTVQPAATFDRGDTVWVYFEARGITSKRADGKFEVWIKFNDLKLYDPDGDMVVHAVDFAEVHETALDEATTYGWFYAYYESTADDVAGQYRFEFTVKDELSGATGTGSATFTLQ